MIRIYSFYFSPVKEYLSIHSNKNTPLFPTDKGYYLHPPDKGGKWGSASANPYKEMQEKKILINSALTKYDKK